MSWSIRLGNGQHAVGMHSARPRLGLIALGVEQAAGVEYVANNREMKGNGKYS